MKKTVLTWILYSVFVIAFNILFFIHTDAVERTVSVWICYVFLHFAYILDLLTPIFASSKGSTNLESKTRTYFLSGAYFSLELVFALIAVYFTLDNTKFVVSTQTIITAAYLYILLPSLLLDNTDEIKTARLKAESTFINDICSKIKYFESISQSPALKSRLYDLYNIAHSSPVMSNADAIVYEEKIIAVLDEIEKYMEIKGTEYVVGKVLEIERLINRRNFLLRKK